MSQSQAAPQDKEQANIRFALGAILVALLLAAFGQTVIAAALPVIVGDLGGIEQISWAITSYLLAGTVASPIFGKLGDMFGRKLMIQIGIVMFSLGSVLAAMSTDMTMLVACRALQGFGGGGLIVVSMAAASELLPPRERGKAQGMLSACYGVSTVVGPLLGGLIVEVSHWRWLFLINIPIAVIAFIVIAIAFKPRTKGEKRSIDYLGTALLTTTLTAFVLVTSLGGTIVPWVSVESIGLAVVTVLGLIGFIVAERRAREPVVPLYLFRNHTFLVGNGLGFLSGMVMFGVITFLPSYLLIVREFSPSRAGLGLIPMVLSLTIASTSTGAFISRTGRYKILPIVAGVAMAIGCTLMATMDDRTSVFFIAAYGILIGIGIGIILNVSMTVVQNSVPLSVIGVATGGATMFRQIGGCVGVAVLGSIFANRLTIATAAVGHPEGSAVFNPATLALLPFREKAMLLQFYVEALHWVYFICAGAGVLVFVLGWMLKERPLSDKSLAHVRPEPSAPVAE